MKITKRMLKRIIREELQLLETDMPGEMSAMFSQGPLSDEELQRQSGGVYAGRGREDVPGGLETAGPGTGPYGPGGVQGEDHFREVATKILDGEHNHIEYLQRMARRNQAANTMLKAVEEILGMSLGAT